MGQPTFKDGKNLLQRGLVVWPKSKHTERANTLRQATDKSILAIRQDNAQKFLALATWKAERWVTGDGHWCRQEALLVLMCQLID